MKNKFIIILILIFLNTINVYAYDISLLNEQLKAISKGTGIYVNLKTGEKEIETYKTYKERNQKVPYEQYFCLIIPNKSYGYLVQKGTLGTVGYVYQTDNYSYYEKRKCTPNVNSYPVINSIKEIK